MYNEVDKKHCREGFQRLKMEMKADLSAHAGNKVLPISDQATSSLINSKKESIKKEETTKTKALSRMKKLLKWAASPKSDKTSMFIKVLFFKNHTTLREVTKDYLENVDDGGRSGGAGKNDGSDKEEESPKISLRWDMESCCTTSSTFSSNSAPVFPPKISTSTSRKGNWVTTHSDFVVLEL